MALILMFILAALNLTISACHAWVKNWPWAVTYLGGFLILVGQIWAFLREV